MTGVIPLFVWFVLMVYMQSISSRKTDENTPWLSIVGHACGTLSMDLRIRVCTAGAHIENWNLIAAPLFDSKMAEIWFKMCTCVLGIIKSN